MERLDLATPDQIGRVRVRAARLARQLPLFESVWVDALAQARLLTPYQAAEINAGRGERLAAGPFVLCQPLAGLGYAQCYQARRCGSRQVVRLSVAECSSKEEESRLEQLVALAALCGRLSSPALAPIQEAGIDNRRMWAVSQYVSGQTTAEWMISNGRFPPEVVLEIARQMLVGLVALERVGVCHGDISAAAVILTDDGRVVLPQPGLRAVLRPEEGYAFADLLPEAYDYLAPERIASGTAPDAASDVYACGCLWWHMLAGRPPIAGGNSLAKLRAVQIAEIPDIRQLAPETPLSLAAAISAAVQRDPRSRSESMVQLAAQLGSPTRVGRRMLVRCFDRRGELPDRWAAPIRGIRPRGQSPLGMAVVAGCLVAAAAIGWSVWRSSAADRAVTTATTDHKSLDSLPTTLPETAKIGGSERESGSPSPGKPNRVSNVREPASVSGKSFPSASLEAKAKLRPGPAVEQGDMSRPRSTDRTGEVKRLILPVDGAVAIDPKALLPQQIVGGERGSRSLVAIPPAGLPVDQEGLCFENVDFVWEGSAADAASQGPAAMIHLRASRVEFHGCSFRAARLEKPLPTAIRWTYPVDAPGAELTLPSGEVRLVDCVFRHVATGVSCRTRGALAFSVSNTLYLGRGPMLQLERWPQVDEPLVIRLSGVTLRASGPLLQSACSPGDSEPGSVTVLAEGCALVPADRAPLVRFVGSMPTERILKNLQWSGQGSLVSPEIPIACGQDARGQPEVLDDAAISMAGLVRGAVEFAGSLESGPAASRVVHWQVPLQSPNAPGIDPTRLAEPKR